MSITLEVSEELLAFIRREVAKGGLVSVGEYVESLRYEEMARVSASRNHQDADRFHRIVR